MFALAAYAFQHTTQQRIDEYLAETAGAVAGALEFERVSGKPFDAIEDDVLEEFRLRDIAVTVLDRQTNGISMPDLAARRRSTPPRTHAAQQLPDLRTILARTKPGDGTTFATGMGDAGLVRVVAYPYRLGGREIVIGAARSLDSQEQTLREARYALGIGIPLILLVATAGGSLLARKSVEPVSAIAERPHASARHRSTNGSRSRTRGTSSGASPRSSTTCSSDSTDHSMSSVA